MSVQDWSTDPNANLTIDGINIAEAAPAANMNNAIRAIMAACRVMYNGLATGTAYVTKAAGVFTDNPTYSGRGGFLYHNDAANTSGRIFIQAAGGSTPAGMVNGDLLFEY
jgi:hypothetical protein